MIDNIRHLHLYSGEYSEEPTYTDSLLRDLWSGLGPPRGHTTTFAACEEVEQCSHVGIHIRHAIARAERPLKKLRSVSLGSYGDSGWSSSKGQVMEKEMIDCFGINNAKGIPQILLGLESVDHFCQSVEYGPLALSPMLFQPLTPLKVFTYHLRAPDHTHVLAQEATPMVVGAINRYYYAASFTVNDDGMKVWSRWPRERQELLGVLIETFKFRKTVVLTSNMTHSGSVGIDTVSLDNTIIELYDYIRLVEGTEEDRDPFIIVRGYSHRACRPAQPLDDIQEELDKALPPRWKGKVLLKNREEAPPCTACGLDLMDEWKDKIKTSMGDPEDDTITCPVCSVSP